MKNNWKNLAPNLVRQRIIVEATTRNFIDNKSMISKYLKQLTKIVGMTAMQDPFVYTAHEDGYGAWQHWKTSGASFYTYPAKKSNVCLITLDCYTCKPFNSKKAVLFTKQFFNTIEIVWKEIKV